MALRNREAQFLVVATILAGGSAAASPCQRSITHGEVPAEINEIEAAASGFWKFLSAGPTSRFHRWKGLDGESNLSYGNRWTASVQLRISRSTKPIDAKKAVEAFINQPASGRGRLGFPSGQRFGFACGHFGSLKDEPGHRTLNLIGVRKNFVVIATASTRDGGFSEPALVTIGRLEETVRVSLEIATRPKSPVKRPPKSGAKSVSRYFSPPTGSCRAGSFRARSS